MVHKHTTTSFAIGNSHLFSIYVFLFNINIYTQQPVLLPRHTEVYFRFKAGAHGGIADAGFDNGKRWQKESHKLYTIPLLELFQRYDVPKEIDYLSLDVEGTFNIFLEKGDTKCAL